MTSYYLYCFIYIQQISIFGFFQVYLTFVDILFWIFYGVISQDNSTILTTGVIIILCMNLSHEASGVCWKT